ncbi:MAG TPA: S1 RNA-binding domain-containing protein, partial [Candidatus Polarisedimenticolia bacterium]|nr:S1 RNA-binding domain-containing protein [Candidatus Polarisedimenticolia bacterium]
MTDSSEPKGPEGAEPESAEEPPKAPVGQEDFAKLLAASSTPREIARGAQVKGTVVQIGDTDVLIDVGGKSEAAMARSELLGPDGDLTVKVGDPIEATVVSAGDTLRVSRRLAAAAQRKDQAREMLIEAYQSRLPVQGRVTASVKGGYEVQVAGVRGFCPFSQIDVRRQEDPTLYFNKTFEFQIKEYDPRKRNLILSRRALIEAEAKKNEAAVRERIGEGMVLPGTIVSLQDFGAFVDLGAGIQGLLHVSEISHSRVAHPKDVLTIGQQLDVHVLKHDRKKGKISLSRKQLETDPWDGVTRRFRPGQVLNAKVVRSTEFGAFLELEPGVDGLLHISELPAGGSKPGDELKVQVLKVEASRKRVSLGLAADKSEPGETVSMKPLRPGDVVTGKVEKVEKFGVFLKIGPGRTGLVPNNELGTPRGADHRRMFPAGTELRAEVIEADPSGRKIRLSVTKAAGREEREAIDKYRKDPSRSGGGSFS